MVNVIKKKLDVSAGALPSKSSHRDGHYNDEEVDGDYVGDCGHGDGEDGDNGVSNGDGDSDGENPSEAPEQMRI